MRTAVITAAFLAALLGGCGDAMKKAETAFDDNFRSSCLSAAEKGGAPAEVAQKACDCTLGKINEKYSGTEKLSLSADKLMPLMNACAQSMVQK
ncbi:MAG: hypothetical protein ABW203_04410 [Novosphingobium sp.]